MYKCYFLSAFSKYKLLKGKDFIFFNLTDKVSPFISGDGEMITDNKEGEEHGGRKRRG